MTLRGHFENDFTQNYFVVNIITLTLYLLAHNPVLDYHFTA